MADINNYLNIIDSLHREKLSRDFSFAEIIYKSMKEKLVEVYIGDTYEDLKSQDSTTKINAVLCGIVKAAYAECLILDCAYVDQATKKPSFGNIVFLNERCIRTITEVDMLGTLKDTFISSKECLIIKNLFEKLKKNE
jgi:hypothetical protein